MFKSRRFGTGIGLGRVDWLLSKLEIDRAWLSSAAIGITGSNGKGSTASMCSAIAQAHSLKTGLFTSPHLFKINERILINGEAVDDEELAQASEKIKGIAALRPNGEEEFGVFELLFCLAVEIFSGKNCEVCVFEVGIGGRFDPVRLTRPSVSVVTSLDLEHTTQLGSTLEAIALDKSDLAPVSSAIFYGSSCEPFKELLASYSKIRNVSPKFYNSDYTIENVSPDKSGTEFTLYEFGSENITLKTPLIGSYQAENAALSYLIFKEWAEKKGKIRFDRAVAKEGLQKTKWPLRLEQISDNPLTIVDVGHTPGGIKAAIEALKSVYDSERFILVVGISDDKDVKKVLIPLIKTFKKIICSEASYRAASSHELAAIVRTLDPDVQVEAIPRVEDAVKKAGEVANQEGLGIYVTGSTFIAADYASALRRAT